MRLSSIIILSLLLTGCVSSKAIYIKGEDGAKAVMEVTMSGGRISLDGPFTYCSEPAVVNGDNGKFSPDSICAALLEKMINE